MRLAQCGSMEAKALSFVLRAAGSEHHMSSTRRMFTYVVGGRVGMNDTCYFTLDMKKLDPTLPPPPYSTLLHPIPHPTPPYSTLLHPTPSLLHPYSISTPPLLHPSSKPLLAGFCLPFFVSLKRFGNRCSDCEL